MSNPFPYHAPDKIVEMAISNDVVYMATERQVFKLVYDDKGERFEPVKISSTPTKGDTSK